MKESFRKRKKVCQLCVGKELNYKNIDALNKYTNEKGKIMPRRMTGACAKHQRYITEQIKRARFMALIPFVK
jgi:small subunit ribosomal protein S18